MNSLPTPAYVTIEQIRQARAAAGALVHAFPGDDNEPIRSRLLAIVGFFDHLGDQIADGEIRVRELPPVPDGLPQQVGEGTDPNVRRMRGNRGSK